MVLPERKSGVKLVALQASESPMDQEDWWDQRWAYGDPYIHSLCWELGLDCWFQKLEAEKLALVKHQSEECISLANWWENLAQQQAGRKR